MSLITEKHSEKYQSAFMIFVLCWIEKHTAVCSDRSSNIKVSEEQLLEKEKKNYTEDYGSTNVFLVEINHVYEPHWAHGAAAYTLNSVSTSGSVCGNMDVI